jgi:hypothetical protein
MLLGILLGFVWALVTIGLGLLSAKAWMKSQEKLQPQEDFSKTLVEIDKNATQKFSELERRMGSIETKVNLLTAFGKGGPK